MTSAPHSPAPDTSPAPDSAATPPPGFDTLGLPPAVLDNLQRLGYLAMTPIQAAALPVALAGRDLIAQARTGSGKTAAYALPLLGRLNLAHNRVQAMVLCPTRELADQVAKEIRRLARAEDNIKVLTLCGGATLKPQAASLAHGAHVVVGTPGRLLDHLQRGNLALEALSTLVLDEADRMLDMGFRDDIAAVADACPAHRQTLLFSATYPAGIAELAGRFLREPEQIRLAEGHAEGRIRQRFYEVAEDSRLTAVSRLLQHYRPANALAFCNTRQQCRDLVAQLEADGIAALALHGELEQRERDQVLVRFANGSSRVLVATDVAARGLDIAGLEAVINVDVAPEPAVHVHRIGRTGRGGSSGADGWALSLVGPRERRRVEALATTHGFTLEWHPLAELESTGEADTATLQPAMRTLQLLAGRKDKLRAGDILGALTGEAGCSREQIGRIDLADAVSYVAVAAEVAVQAARRLGEGRIKGKRIRVRLLED